MPVALVNRFSPPDAAPTAAALARLAGLLGAREPRLDFRFVGPPSAEGARRYVGGGAAGEGNPLRRLTGSWRDGREMAAAAARFPVVLSLTDPPFLSLRLARRLPPSPRCLCIEWTMDLYPAALWAAAGLRPRCFPPPFCRSPDLRLCLGPGQAAFLETAGSIETPHSASPAGVVDPPSRPPLLPSPGEPLRLVYAGNLGRAHWADGLILLARMLDPARFRLSVAAYGAQAARVRASLAALPQVEWRDRPLSAAELDAAHVHIACLKENWTHVCVPSKAITALCRGRPVLFFGSAASDVWGWTAGGGARLDPDRTATVRGLPDVLARLATPDRLAEMTEAARAAGDALRAVEARTADALVERLIPYSGRRLGA